MKKNGFIATSLIYSFFLVFLAIIMALLSSYMANKTILDRYNEEAMDKLNGDEYTVKVYVKNASTKTGVTLTNLIVDGNFINGTESWTQVGNAQYTPPSALGIAIYSADVKSYIKQTLPPTYKNHKYYYTVTFNQPNHSETLMSYIYEASTSETLQTYKSSDYIKLYKVKQYSSDSSTRQFVVGYCSQAHSERTFFKDVMVLDLTASYGAGNEPPASWIGENVDWINGSSKFIYQDGIEKGTSFSLEMTPYEGFTKSTIRCNDNSGASVQHVLTNNTLIINNIAKNVTCNVEWSA